MSEEFPSPQLIDDLEEHPQHDNARVVKDLLAGTAGGIAQVLVGQPLIRQKLGYKHRAPQQQPWKSSESCLPMKGLAGFTKEL